jgi:hypothetical protein
MVFYFIDAGTYLRFHEVTLPKKRATLEGRFAADLSVCDCNGAITTDLSRNRRGQALLLMTTLLSINPS